jgi:hypothetical protein
VEYVIINGIDVDSCFVIRKDENISNLIVHEINFKSEDGLHDCLSFQAIDDVSSNKNIVVQPHLTDQ